MSSPNIQLQVLRPNIRVTKQNRRQLGPGRNLSGSHPSVLGVLFLLEDHVDSTLIHWLVCSWLDHEVNSVSERSKMHDLTRNA